MPRKKPEPKTISCLHCKESFSTTDCRKKFCNEDCRIKYHQNLEKEKTKNKKAKKLKSREALFDGSAFAYYLVSECKRAGTVEALSQHTADSFLELHKLSKKRTSYSGFKDGKVGKFYELSHIQPVKQAIYLGLLHPDNLVIATNSFNRKRKSKIPANKEAGKKIARTELFSKWSVSKDDEKESVLQKIKRFLGSSIINSFYEEAKLTLTQKNKLLKKLSKLGIEASEKLSQEHLEEIYQEATGKTIANSFKREETSIAWVLKEELERLNIDAGKYTQLLEQILHESEYYFISKASFTKQQEQFIFHQVQCLLHGDSLQAFDLESIESHAPNTERELAHEKSEALIVDF